MSPARRRFAGPHAGFTLVELLLASMITVVIMGALFSIVAPAQRVFQVQPEVADLQQRMRVGADTMRQTLIVAGAGLDWGPAAGPLLDFIAPVLPYRAFGDATDPSRGVYFRSDAITLLSVESVASQTSLAAPLPAGSTDARLSVPSNCPGLTATQLCGFEAGDSLLVFDQGSHVNAFRVLQVDGVDLRLAHRGGGALVGYETGALVAKVTSVTYEAQPDAATGAYQLMRYDGWQSDLPIVDNIVKLEFEYFGDPQPPQLTGRSLDLTPGPWTTYGPPPPPLAEHRGTWADGESCVFQVVDGRQVPRLPAIGSGTRPVRLSAAVLSDGPWCPDSAAPNRFDADLLRIRRVRVTLRIQAALSSMRGPAGRLFAKGGTALAGSRYVPDLEVHFDVTPRNLNLARGQK
jgi:hypothetical protein